MSNRVGFHSDAQEANFAAARVAFQRGQSSAPVCGARTRTSGICRDVPIKGSNRCIRHCGPKAAREYRERQRLAFLRGKIPAVEWFKAEAKRARNRLHDQWKKNPWLPGRTIDLGRHETEFVDAIRSRPCSMAELPPAVMDWLRWRFRRLQIDRRDDSGWRRCLIDELPRRVLTAGPAPEGWTPDTDTLDMGTPDMTIVIRLHQSPKRQRADTPKPKRARQTRAVRPRGRPRKTPRLGEGEALAVTFYKHRDILAPMLERCPTQQDRDAALRILHDHLQAPGDDAKARRWRDVVMRLR